MDSVLDTRGDGGPLPSRDLPLSLGAEPDADEAVSHPDPRPKPNVFGSLDPLIGEFPELADSLR